jgi:hypothetical protein
MLVAVVVVLLVDWVKLLVAEAQVVAAQVAQVLELLELLIWVVAVVAAHLLEAMAALVLSSYLGQPQQQPTTA